MIDTDIFIIGSGGSGCSAALEVSFKGLKVNMITKGPFLSSKTFNAQGGIQASMRSDDSPLLHKEDTLKAGEYQNDTDLVDILVNNAKSTILWLEGLGVRFDKDSNDYVLQTAAGLTKPRILSCGDKSGNRLMGPLKNSVLDSDTNVYEYTYPKLIVKTKNGFLIKTGSRDQGDKEYHTKCMIIACGGYIAPEKRQGIQNITGHEIPDIFDLLSELDVKVVFPDLVQYHPTGILLPKQLRRERIPETVRSSGANILNKNMEAFCNPMETRNKLTNIIVQECKKGKGIKTDDGRIGVWLNTPRVNQISGEGYLKNKFPNLYKKFKHHGIDIETEMILVYPILHYSLGGIKININTSTNIEGIFAAGEATYGVHGKDRLMGNSLLEIFVFGRLAGQNALRYCKTNN